MERGYGPAVVFGHAGDIGQPHETGCVYVGGILTCMTMHAHDTGGYRSVCTPACIHDGSSNIYVWSRQSCVSYVGHRGRPESGELDLQAHTTHMSQQRAGRADPVILDRVAFAPIPPPKGEPSYGSFSDIGFLLFRQRAILEDPL